MGSLPVLKAREVVARLGSSHDQGYRFDNPVDMQVTAQGAVVLYDAARRTAVSLRSDGSLQDSVRLTRDVHQLSRTADGGFTGLDVLNVDVAGFRFDSTGQVVSKLLLPAFMRNLDLIVRATVVSQLPGSDTLVAAFQSASGFLLWPPGAAVPRLVRGVEEIRFDSVLSWQTPQGYTVKRLAPTATYATRYVAADARHIYQLFAGTTALASRLIDVYSRRDGRYEWSYRVPRTIAGLAPVPNGFVTVSTSPKGEVDIWELTPKR